MHLIKLSIHFAVSVLIAYTLASVAHTQQVLAGLLQLGVKIPPRDRLSMFAGDWTGLYLYLLVIALGFLIAFVIMTLLKRIVSIPEPILFAIGGALAMLCILVSMRELASLTPIAGARGMLGFSLQCLAGAVGGGCLASASLVSLVHHPLCMGVRVQHLQTFRLRRENAAGSQFAVRDRVRR